MSTRCLATSLGLLCLALASPALSATTFEFRTPTGLMGPPNSSSVTVPNNLVFDAISEAEAEAVPVIRAAIQGLPDVRTLRYLSFSFPTPTVQLSGEETRVIATLSGVSQANIGLDWRLHKWYERLFCGSYIRASVDIRDLAVGVDYDFFTGEPQGIAVDYSYLNADGHCSLPILGLIGQLLIEIGVVDVTEIVVARLEDAEAESGQLLSGEFGNMFSLQDALAGFSESGPREVRAAAEDVIRLLGGLTSAAATFISQNLHDDLADRLNLQTQAELDALRDRLDGLEEFIAAGLIDLTLQELAGYGFDLSAYLEANIPDVEAFLLGRLNGYYANAVVAVRDLEARAIDAIDQFVNADWSRLIGGVNVRLRLDRPARHVLLEAFHDAPASFIGRAEANSPCFPEYTIAATENVSSYSIYAGGNQLFYQGLDRTRWVAGLLSFVSVENYFGLHSYPTPATIQLYAWGDYAGNRNDFRWPQCAPSRDRAEAAVRAEAAARRGVVAPAAAAPVGVAPVGAAPAAAVAVGAAAGRPVSLRAGPGQASSVPDCGARSHRLCLRAQESPDSLGRVSTRTLNPQRVVVVVEVRGGPSAD